MEPPAADSWNQSPAAGLFLPSDCFVLSTEYPRITARRPSIRQRLDSGIGKMLMKWIGVGSRKEPLNSGLMLEMSSWSLSAVLVAFACATVAIGVCGTGLTRVTDRLADVTGWGEALTGGVLLGSVTSLSGSVASVTAAWEGHPDLAVSNGLGGIAVQTVFLAIADMVYRGANLEHAASSLPNMFQGALLVVLLALPILAMAGPDISWWGVHPVSVVLVGTYIWGVRMASRTQRQPMWAPRITAETRLDEAEDDTRNGGSMPKIWVRFLGLSMLVGISGFVVANAGVAIAQRTVLSEALVGGFFTSTCTSLPELVTSIAAVRRGALTLAVGGIIGGNCFDVLFVSFSDVAFRDGSIYHAISSQQLYIMALTILLSGLLLMGLLRREKHGIANIGFESFLILVVYVLAFCGLALGG